MAVINCPECGAMFSDELSVCPECGYDFEAPEAPEDESIGETVKPVTAIDLCAENEDALKKAKIIKAKDIINKIGYGALIVAIAVCIFVGSNVEGIGFVITKIVTFALTAVSMILMTVGTIMLLSIPRKKMLSLLPTSQGKEVSLTDVIGNTLNVDYTKAAPEYIEKQKTALSEVIDCERYLNYEKFRKSYKRTIAFNIIMNIIISILLCITIIVCFNYVMDTVQTQTAEVNLEYLLILIDKVKFILLALAVVVAVMITVGALRVSPTIKKRRAWVAANFPDKVEIYDQHLKDTKAIKAQY